MLNGLLQRGIPVCVVLVLLGCGGGEDGPGQVLSGQGENCTKTADCEAGLKCMGFVCVVDALPDTQSDIVTDAGLDTAGSDVPPTPPDDATDTVPDLLPDAPLEVGVDGSHGEIGPDTCQPQCGGKECGDDGCGGSCGSCDDTNPCTDDSCTTGVGCEHVPGNEGGLCNNGQGVCVQGTCCIPDCGGKECGDDGCGGNCGTCGNGEACQNGQCVVIAWTDPTTGLTWQVTPTGGAMNWSDAKTHCAGLSLDGGGWHLPTIGHLRTLIRGCPVTEDGGSCNVQEGDCLASSCRDDSCDGCSGGKGPADGCYWPGEMEGACNWYWSSSAVADGGYEAWAVHFNDGVVHNDDVDYYGSQVRCVR